MSLDAQRLEQTLAFHCAPSLSGIKPADLFTWNLPESEGEELLADYAALLARRARAYGSCGGGDGSVCC